MHLSRLYIENYRSIEKLDLFFHKGKNVIVGKNNSGKSNIIRAIDFILGESSPTWEKSESITEMDFFCGDMTKEIFIWCELNKDEGEILDFSEVENSVFFRILLKGFDIKKEIDFSKKDDIFYFCSREGEAQLSSSPYSKYWIGGKTYCKKSINDEFKNMSNFALAFRAKKEEDGSLRKELVFLYKEKDSMKWFFSTNAQLRTCLMQSAIIPSFRDPKDQLRIAAYTWFGKLLKAYTKENPTLSEAFKNVEEASNELFKTLREKICEGKIQIAFPNTEVSFQFNPAIKQDAYKSALVYVDDGFKSELKDKGSGIQSALIIGLFQFYIRNVAHTTGSLLAIEEPEVYLHPHGRRVISDRLSEFLEGGKNQVIITSHSVEFVCCINEDLNLIVAKRDGNKTTAKNIEFNTPKYKQILIKKQNAEMFFADAVLLVEGADKYLFEGLSKEFGISKDGQKCIPESCQICGTWLNDLNVSIINCGGKEELWKYADILNKLTIPCMIVTDFDFIRGGLNNYLTRLGFEQGYIDRLNSLKSRIPPTSKKIDDVSIAALQEEILIFIKELKDKGVFILKGELEDYYKIKPTYPKEYGVIETISKSIEDNKKISEYIITDEFEEMFLYFLKLCLGISLQPQAVNQK